MTISIYIILGILAGACFPIQATINAKLRAYTKTPFSASLVAFSVGATVLFIILMLFDRYFFHKIDFSYPITTFLGGATSGIIFNVANIILFTKIGATITTLVTITGQMIMGTLLDHFGLLNLAVHEVSLTRFLGITLMIIALIIYQRSNNRSSIMQIRTQSANKIWIALGLCAGIFPPLQAVFNGQLRLATDSVLTSTFLSFFIGAILLAVIVLLVEKRIKIPLRDANNRRIPIWVYTGGLFGILIVGGTIVVIHQLGAVLTSLVFIFGQLSMAVFVDHFGLFGLTKRPISTQTIASLSLMIIALFLV